MQKGFTLIEILFVILILAVAVIVIIPNLRKFSEDQDLSSYADKLKQALRVAQSGASSSIKCSVLPTSSWKVSLTASQFNTVAVCKDPASETPPQKETKATTTFLPSTSVTISDDNCKALTGSVEADIVFSGNTVRFVCKDGSTPAGPFTVTFAKPNSQPVTVTIEEGGSIH